MTSALISFDEALQRTVDSARLVGTEEVSLQRAYGRVLRQDVRSTTAIPPFDRSRMDGFALRSRDVRGATPRTPVALEISDDIPAGVQTRRPVTAGSAARISTGAPLPPGADAVVKLEDTVTRGTTLQVMQAAAPGTYVGPAGEDVAQGAVILSSGTVIGPAQAGMIGACGLARVRAARQLRVSVLSTGNEIVRPGARQEPGQIFDANGASLLGLARNAGARARFLGLARDKPGELERRLRRAEDADVLVLSGGVSVGVYDFVHTELERLGFATVFHRIAMKPGKPVFLGRRGSTAVFGLPGNPVSCMVGFQLLVRPYLDTCSGSSQVGLPRVTAVLQEAVTEPSKRRKFLRARLACEGPTLTVRCYDNQSSGVLRSMVSCNALIDMPGELSFIAAGSQVTVVPLQSPADLFAVTTPGGGSHG